VNHFRFCCSLAQHFQKMPLYNAVNALQRYDSIEIHSPSEVIEDEDQDI
jgi:hypothetical protein